MTTDSAREAWIERLAAAIRAEWDSQTYPAYAFLSGPLSDQQKYGLSKLAARIAADFAERLAMAERATGHPCDRPDGCIGTYPLPWAEAMKKDRE